MKTLYYLLFAFTLSFGHDNIPGKPQNSPILLKNGTVHTVSNGRLEQTDILFIQGKITQIGKNLTAPEHSQIIDISGKHVYPGLISAYTNLGLTEIDAVRSTQDYSEVGSYTPEAQSHTAYNPDSELIPTVSINGITTAHVAPKGGVISGRSSVLQLDGWTKEDAGVVFNNGLHIHWPQMNIIHAWWMKKTDKEQEKEIKENLETLYTYISNAKSYHLQRTTNQSTAFDHHFEAMRPLFTKKMKLFLHADDAKQIEAIIYFSTQFDMDIVLVGGMDSWKFTDALKLNQIPVVLGQIQRLPRHEDDDYDLPFRLPMLLKKAGVQFAISGAHQWTGENWGARNLAFQAGQAVAFGLEYDEALRAITLSAAEILGINTTQGSIEIAKQATLVVSEGDILDPLTQKVTHMFIDGRSVELNNRQLQLYKKYQKKTLN